MSVLNRYLADMGHYSRRFTSLSCIMAAMTLVVSNCADNSGEKADPVQWPRVDAARVLADIRKQVSFGPRVPGTEASAKCREYISATLDSLGYTVRPQEFTHFDPRLKRSIKMVNLLCQKGNFVDTILGRRPVLLCAHFDSRPRSDRDPDSARRNDSLPGANDGASGVAMLVELARNFQSTSPAVAVEFAFFDGEDWGEAGDVEQFSVGAKEFVKAIPRERYRFAILVDIYAHRGAVFYREEYSHKFAGSLTDKVWAVAKDLGVKRFVDSVGLAIYDDHLPLLANGIPTVDIIDLSYPEWHTSRDLPEACDSATIAEVGNVIATVIYREKVNE